MDAKFRRFILRGALFMGLVVCLAPRTAGAGELGNLTKLMDIYANEWPPDSNAKAHLMRLKLFEMNAAAALDYLASLDPKDDDSRRAVAVARGQIYRAANQWAWTRSIPAFKISVVWGDSDSDVQNRTYFTLIRLSMMMAERLKELQATKATNLSTVQELYATLLSQVLPIYFVKAANISQAISLMEQAFGDVPGFFDLACTQRDYPASNTSNILQDAAYRYDCGRGFLVKKRKADGGFSIVLTQNPEADIPSTYKEPVTNYIAKVYE